MSKLFKRKTFLVFILIYALTTYSVCAENAQRKVSALSNSIDVTVNDKISDTEGQEVEVNGSEFLESEPRIIELDDYSKPLINYAELGVDRSEIYGVMFKVNSESSEFNYKLTTEGLVWDQYLDFGEAQEITIVKSTGGFVNLMVVANSIPTILPVQDIRDNNHENSRQIIYMPSNPDKGFNFPYYIFIPDNEMDFVDRVGNGKYTPINTNKKYLIFEMINTGYTSKAMGLLEDVVISDQDMGTYGNNITSMLKYPTVVPVVPRTGVTLEMDGFGTSQLYEHSLDRVSLYLKELTTTDSHAEANIKALEDEDIDYKKLYDLDEQMKAIMEDAIQHLNANGVPVEDKVILNGYSASGVFADRFATLHPEIVEMAICGSTLVDPYLPTASYKGQELNYPLGTADYKEITGREFSIEDYNSVTRFLYRGTEDDNTPFGYTDCFTVEGNRILDVVYGGTKEGTISGAKDVYRNTGAEVLTAMHKGAGHWTGSVAVEVVVEFIARNADSDVKVLKQSTNTDFIMEVFGD